MAATRVLALLAQSIIQLPQRVGSELDDSKHEHVQQLMEQLSLETTRLLQELERGAFAWGALLFAALRQWQFWAIAGVMVLLFRLCCWLRKRSQQPKKDTLRDEADKEEPEEIPSVALDLRWILATRLLDLSESFTMVEELVDELLRICQKLSWDSFVPRLGPVIGVSSTLQGWIPCEEEAVYRLLVPLKPPRGHAFHLEMGSATEDTLARKASLRVDLRCTCMKEPLAEDMLCFLHHPEEELREKQGPSLLHTFCTGPYLDIDTTARWLQMLLKDAWAVMPQSRHCCLTVLPSKHSCKLQMTHTSNRTILIELMFGVKQGDSYAFLSCE
ncbi:inositol 1,4,5-trisphosphate receptor-interacting protein-like 1 [Larus michahellis]|uniref:inositol 1,4,5-trisphosphate receptor-interacting protein-like 1 n=1 Tax=Larus michahellis TaxID=119627 RepID=UPI003D9BBDCC